MIARFRCVQCGASRDEGARCPTCGPCRSGCVSEGKGGSAFCCLLVESASPRAVSLLPTRIEQVRDAERVDADKYAALHGEDCPLVLRMRERVAELSEIARLQREDR